MTSDVLSPAAEPAIDLDDARQRQALALIWREGHLLDAHAYQQWDALWAAGGEYIIPIDHSVTDFAATLNLVYDDERMRRMRIERLTGGMSISATAAARTTRTLSRHTVESVAGDRLILRSAQVLVGYKRGETFVLAADVLHTVQFTEGGPRIARKVVYLVNSQDTVTASGFLL